MRFAMTLAGSIMALSQACLPSPEVWVAEDSPLLSGESRTIQGWYRYSEGPARNSAGDIFFSNLPGAQIFRWQHATGDVDTFRDNGVVSNGLAFGPDGRLYACEPYERRVVAISVGTGAEEVIASGFGGQPLNSPNDVWVDREGGVWFTDPRYSKDREMKQDGEHVYWVPPKRDRVVRVLSELGRPNGIVGSADGRYLYVVDDSTQRTLQYEVGADGALSQVRSFGVGADGLTLDAEGRLFVVDDGVHVYDKAGRKVAQLDLPFRVTNLTFGGADRRTLFITGKWVVHAMPMMVPGDGS